ISLSVAVLEDRGGVHADADHALGDSFVEGFLYLLLGHLLPAALNGVIVIDDAAGLGLGRHILAGAARQDSRNGHQQEHTDQHQPEVGRQGFLKVLLCAFQHAFFPPWYLRCLGYLFVQALAHGYHPLSVPGISSPPAWRPSPAALQESPPTLWGQSRACRPAWYRRPGGRTDGRIA